MAEISRRGSVELKVANKSSFDSQTLNQGTLNIAASEIKGNSGVNSDCMDLKKNGTQSQKIEGNNLERSKTGSVQITRVISRDPSSRSDCHEDHDSVDDSDELVSDLSLTPGSDGFMAAKEYVDVFVCDGDQKHNGVSSETHQSVVNSGKFQAHNTSNASNVVEDGNKSEAQSRFRVVKVDNYIPSLKKKGRWTCKSFHENTSGDKNDKTSEDIAACSISSSGSRIVASDDDKRHTTISYYDNSMLHEPAVLNNHSKQHVLANTNFIVSDAASDIALKSSNGSSTLTYNADISHASHHLSSFDTSIATMKSVGTQKENAQHGVLSNLQSGTLRSGRGADANETLQYAVMNAQTYANTHGSNIISNDVHATLAAAADFSISGVTADVKRESNLGISDPSSQVSNVLLGMQISAASQQPADNVSQHNVLHYNDEHALLPMHVKQQLPMMENMPSTIAGYANPAQPALNTFHTQPLLVNTQSLDKLLSMPQILDQVFYSTSPLANASTSSEGQFGKQHASQAANADADMGILESSQNHNTFNLHEIANTLGFENNSSHNLSHANDNTDEKNPVVGTVHFLTDKENDSVVSFGRKGSSQNMSGFTGSLLAQATVNTLPILQVGLVSKARTEQVDQTMRRYVEHRAQDGSRTNRSFVPQGLFMHPSEIAGKSAFISSVDTPKADEDENSRVALHKQGSIPVISSTAFVDEAESAAMISQSGSSISAVSPSSGGAPIDNKIERAMDLVKSYLMIAVKEEVEDLREQIKVLTERNNQLEYENAIFRSAAGPDVLAKLSRT